MTPTQFMDLVLECAGEAQRETTKQSQWVSMNFPSLKRIKPAYVGEDEEIFRSLLFGKLLDRNISLSDLVLEFEVSSAMKKAGGVVHPKRGKKVKGYVDLSWCGRGICKYDARDPNSLVLVEISPAWTAGKGGFVAGDEEEEMVFDGMKLRAAKVNCPGRIGVLLIPFLGKGNSVPKPSPRVSGLRGMGLHVVPIGM